MTQRISRPTIYLSLAVILAAVLYAGLSIAQYRGYNSGMLDLGNMSQAIGSVLRGQPLITTRPTGNESRLAAHVEFIYILLAPLMWLWPDPQILLIVQALLMATAAIPVYRIACRRLPPFASLSFALGYLVFPTAVAAVLFDLHGDTLAMPILLWLLDALDTRAWRRFWLYFALSLLSKFYVAAPLFVLGLTLLSARTAPLDLGHVPRRRRLGIAISAIAAAYGAIVVFGVRPFFASPVSNDLPNYASYYFGGLATIGVAGVLDRLVNLLAVVLPTALLWWWARWTTLPALAIILPATVSTGPGSSYAWSYHHYAVAVPFLVVGSIIGAAHRANRVTSARLHLRELRAGGVLFFAASLLFHVGLNDTPLSIPFWRSEPGSGLDASGYGRTSRDALKDRWLTANVPPGAPIAASNFLAPHLSLRDTLYLVRYPDEPRADRLQVNLARVQTAIPDALFDYAEQTGAGFVGGVTYDLDAIRVLLQTPGWGLTAARDGLLRFDRNPAPGRALDQKIRQVDDPTPGSARFGDALEMVAGSITPTGSASASRRFRATFRWRALRDLRADEQFVAVSTLAGVSDARIVHLPSYALQPTSSWRAGQVWEEQFEVEIPAEVTAGRYDWNVGWYDERSIYAARTDARSRIGAEARVTALDLP